MLLSTQLFDRIVGLSGSRNIGVERTATVLPVGCRRAAERRTATRLAFGHRTQICRDSGKTAGTWETVMLQDISPQGIGYLCHDSMETGCTFVLKLADKDGETIRIRCKVRRCERGGFGNTAYLLGATFENVIQQQALRVNDEPDDIPRWQEATQDEPDAVPAGSESAGMKTAGTAMARVATQLLRVVEPFRAATQWMRRCDDFS